MCKLNKKFKEWRKWYSEDNNSVCAQIRKMLWDAAVFHAINEARKYANADNQGTSELNNMVHSLINRTFFQTQALSIRKLCDRRRDAISLHRIIRDIKTNKALLTRKNILSALELPYDYEEKINEGHQNNDSNKVMKGAFSENVHENIDLLAKVKCTERQPNDTVKNCVFKKLNRQLSKCEPIVQFVHNIVAHAETMRNRGNIPENDLKISLAKIHKAHYRIIRTAAFIGQVILYESSGQNFLPSYAGNKFEYFEKPWARQADIAKLENFWSRYEKHIERMTKKSFKFKNNP